MRTPISRALVSFLALAGAVGALAAAPPPELGRTGMVAADHQLASEAGRNILAAGGNAVDAAVATALASGVVQPAGSGLGGGGFAVVVLPDGTRSVLDFREEAPAKAHRDMYVEAKGEKPSRIGGLANAVPGEARGLETLHKRHGKLAWADVVAPAIQLASDGFEVEHHLAKALGGLGTDGLPLASALFDVTKLPRQGDTVSRSALANTLKQLATDGADALHTGKGAKAIAKASKATGGILTAKDLAAYQPKDRAPIVGAYRDWTIITMPPPSSGGVVLVQMLGVLEAHDLAALGHNSSAYVHLVTEASKHAFADRARVMGDKDGAEFPWLPKPCEELGAGPDVNTTAILSLLVDDVSDGAAADASVAALKKFAKEKKDQWTAASKEEEPDFPIDFGYGDEDCGIVGPIRSFTNLRKSSPVLFILDVPNGKKFMWSGTGFPTADDFAAMVDGYVAGTLPSVGIKDTVA